MLRGFALDMPPGVCHVWKYCFPLFIQTDNIDLRFGYRLHNGFVVTRGRSDLEVAREISGIIRKNNDFAEEENVSDLLTFVADDRVSAQSKLEAGSAVDEFFCNNDEALIRRANELKAKLRLR